VNLHGLIRGDSAYRPGFRGTWRERIGDLFDCGVDFRNRTILDVGCNMGIIAYEIAKREPQSIHGVDIDKNYTRVARMIFHGIPLESRFDRLDLTRSRDVARVLKPSYDIVVFLAVYRHLRKAKGQTVALGATEQLFSRCGETFILRTRSSLVPEIEKVASRFGLSLVFKGRPMNGYQSAFHVFSRAGAPSGEPVRAASP
jgi:hypothetical protein